MDTRVEPSPLDDALSIRPSADVRNFLRLLAVELHVSEAAAAEHVLDLALGIRRVLLVSAVPAPEAADHAIPVPGHRPSMETILAAVVTALGIISALLYLFVFRRH